MPLQIGLRWGFHSAGILPTDPLGQSSHSLVQSDRNGYHVRFSPGVVARIQGRHAY